MVTVDKITIPEKYQVMAAAIAPTVAEPVQDTAEPVQESRDLLKRCCQAPGAFRAGLSVEEARRLYSIPCDKKTAGDCCECWQLMEKVELYAAQSAAAKAGEVTMLKHLGKAVLYQDGRPRVIDPGLGDLLFVRDSDDGNADKTKS